MLVQLSEGPLSSGLAGVCSFYFSTFASTQGVQVLYGEESESLKILICRNLITVTYKDHKNVRLVLEVKEHMHSRGKV